MKHKYNRWIMGAAIGITALVVTVDHNHYHIQTLESTKTSVLQERAGGISANPCSLNVSP